MTTKRQKGVIAVMLAAGVGKRLGQHDAPRPKVLLEIDGASLLERHLRALAANGVERVFITTGFEAATLEPEATRLAATLGLKVAFTPNPRFREGSVVSLAVQGERLRAGDTVLLLDGDVLYDRRMLARLIAAPPENTLLMDREIEPGDEPVKICLDAAGRIVDFRKVPADPGVRHGESVGFFRFSSAMAAVLADRCDLYVREGRAHLEYEEAIRDLILAQPTRFGIEDVSDLPWTEIDFPEDVARARTAIAPQLEHWA